MKSHKLLLVVLVALFGIISLPGEARADATCSGLLPAKFAYLREHGGYYTVEITVIKDSLAYVTYSKDWVWLSEPYLFGYAKQQFSDRFNGNQNFNINATENTRVWNSETGTLWIYNDTYSYWIVSGADMSCSGNLMNKFIPGLGMVTVAIRGWGVIG